MSGSMKKGSLIDTTFEWAMERLDRHLENKSETYIGTMTWFLFFLLAALSLIPSATLRFYVVLFFGFGSFAFLIGAIRKLTRHSRQEFLLRNTAAMGELKRLNPGDFELLVTAILKSEGWTSTHTGKMGPDGGVDAVATKNGEDWLVQVKKWQSESIGVDVVRQMHGIARQRDSFGVMVFTLSDFTSFALEEFGDQKNTLLVGGGQILRRLENLRKSTEILESDEGTELAPFIARINEARTQGAVIRIPLCDKCNQLMILKFSRKNSQKFWGCSGYKTGRCDFMKPLTALEIKSLDPDR